MPSSTRQVWGLFPLALVLGASLYAAGFWMFSPLQKPSPDGYQQMQQQVRQQWQSGDAWAVRPWWAGRARETLGDLPSVLVRDLAGEDLSHFGRIWVLILPGYLDELGGPFSDGTYPIEDEREFGKLTLRRYRLPPKAQVLYNFRERLQEAKVRMFSGNTAKDCSPWIENRWICSNRDWNYVGRMVVELGDDPREIIWAHPSDTGPIEITYERVPGGRTLLVHTGFTPPAARVLEGAVVTLEVLVDGNLIGKVSQPNQTGYFPRAMELGALGPGPHTVTFRVSCPNIGMRHFCFDAEVRQ